MNDPRTDTTYRPHRKSTVATEPQKSIVSNRIIDIICWHIWGVISVSVSVVLMWLNFAELAMGATVGRNSGDTANIIVALQLLIQMHALSISASLVQIARQWILGSLLTLDRGIPLGLVGAERQMGLPSFVISHGYLAAVKYSASLWWGPQTQAGIQSKWHVGMVTAFLFVSCILSVLAGPASGALMIPRVHWFFDSSQHYDVFEEGFNTYPYVMLPRHLGHNTYDSAETPRSIDPFSYMMDNRTSEYWHQVSKIGRRYSPTTELLTSHHVPTAAGIGYVNASTTWGRKMDDGPAAGSSYAQLAMVWDTVKAMDSLVSHPNLTKTTTLADYHDAMRHWSQRQYVLTDATAVATKVNCQYREKVSCPPTMDPKTAPWCLEGSVTHLILLSQSDNTAWRIPRRDGALVISRAYITEGPSSETHPQFTDSLQVVPDGAYIPLLTPESISDSTSTLQVLLPSTKAIVCSISTVITPAMMSSFTTRMDGKFLHCPFRDNQTPRYHEHWLDRAITNETGFIDNSTGIVPFAARSMVQLAHNSALLLFGKTVNIIDPLSPETDPAWLEITIAGAFASIYSNVRRSTSQYAIEDNIELPESMILEPRVHNPANTGFTIEVYNQGYGFRLSTTVSVFAVALLILHAAIVVVGSLWQLCWERRVINAWSTVPEYLALGHGSVLDESVLKNTCVGISAGESLRTIVTVGVTSPEHLELQVGGMGLKPVLGQYDAKYGSCAKRHHTRRDEEEMSPDPTESISGMV